MNAAAGPSLAKVFGVIAGHSRFAFFVAVTLLLPRCHFKLLAWTARFPGV
jgi:hypothetical protein